MNNTRRVLALIEIDDNQAIGAGVGTLDYLDKNMSLISSAGIIIKDARILDVDDSEDEKYIESAKMIFPQM